MLPYNCFPPTIYSWLLYPFALNQAQEICLKTWIISANSANGLKAAWNENQNNVNKGPLDLFHKMCSFVDRKLRRCHLLPDYISTIPNLSARYTRPRALPSSGSRTAPIGRRDNIKFRSEAPCCVHGLLLCSLPHWLSGQGAAAVRTYWKFIYACISVASRLSFATWRKDD